MTEKLQVYKCEVCGNIVEMVHEGKGELVCVRLRGQKPGNCNQRVRWVMNKEDHANELQHIVSQYFMTQRIKLDTENYSQKLSVLHKMLVYAMKCKQTTDLSHISMLQSLLKEFQNLYFDHSYKEQ